jgi:hypothetical protein
MMISSSGSEKRYSSLLNMMQICPVILVLRRSVDRLKDGESAVQAPRRMIPNAVSQRWDTNGRFIQLRNKKDLVLTVDVSMTVGAISFCLN